MWRWVTVLCLAGGLNQAPPRVDIPDGRARRNVIQAIAGAQRRLTRPECQRVFTDFQDAGGRPLADRLQASTFTAAEYLSRQILFFAGDDAPACRRPGAVAAYTAPGYQVVHVCTTRFMKQFERDPAVLEILVIHEMLHTLGLGENPPSSSVISGQVTRRCGRR